MSIQTYKIEDINELIGVNKTIVSMNKWYENLENKMKFLVLSGQTGCGKTTLGGLYLKDKGYEVLYFDISFIKSKQHMIKKIVESFKTFDICSMLKNEKKKMGYVIDNIESSIFSKNDIVELHNLFIKNDAIRPLILIGKFNKLPSYPKKKIEHIKISMPSDISLLSIGEILNKKFKLDINKVQLNLIVSKSQNDIKRLYVLLDYIRNYDIDNKSIIAKDCDYNLFTDFSNLVSQYKNIKKTNIFSDQIILLNYTFHQNTYNIIKNNCKTDMLYYLYDFYRAIFRGIKYEYMISKYQCWELTEYIYFNGPKYISYHLNKIKKNKNMSIEIDYPKYCYILNQKNSYKKLIQLFKNFDFYDSINTNNFEIFLKDLFNNEIENKHIISELKNVDIECLKKLINK